MVILIEHQSSTDTLMPLRLLYFAITYWDRQWREWKSQPGPKPELKLNPVVPIVFYTGATPWGSNRTIVDLLGEPEVFHKFAPVWEPVFWNLSERLPEDLLASANAWTQVLAVVRAEQEDAAVFKQVFSKTIEQVRRLSTNESVRWYDLMRVVLTWGIWKRPETEREDLLRIVNEEQNKLQRSSYEELETMNKNLGLTYGQQVYLNGILDGNRKSLRYLLESRFGPLPNEWLDRINQTNDPEKLQLALLQVYKVEKLDEIQI